MEGRFTGVLLWRDSDKTDYKGYGGSLRRCLHDTWATFIPARLHPSSVSWLCIRLHDTTTKCRTGASRTGVRSPRLLYRSENFILVRNDHSLRCDISLSKMVSCKPRWTCDANQLSLRVIAIRNQVVIPV